MANEGSQMDTNHNDQLPIPARADRVSKLEGSPTNGSEPLDLIKAAKVVVALSGWTKVEGREVFQSSYMAVEVLRAAIQQAENPQLRLAPEPLPRGL